MLPSYLSESHLDAIVRRALDEDVGSGDVTTLATVEEGRAAVGTIQAKEAGVLAGAVVATRVFAQVDGRASADWLAGDGDRVEAGAAVARIEGPARALLVAERLALNVLQRMSGIATATRRMVDAARPHGAEILDTRKTVPGLRPLDKWAVRLGGGTNHRIGLFDQILIKDNHIEAAGGVEAALDRAADYRQENDPGLDIEIETRTLEEVRAAAGHDAADILLLDNMVTVADDGSVDTDRLAEAVSIVDGRARTEASGNVTLETVAPIAATGVDAISSGALTHSVTALDLSMEMRLEG